VLHAVASTASPIASLRSPPKRANSARPENGQRLAGYGRNTSEWIVCATQSCALRQPALGVMDNSPADRRSPVGLFSRPAARSMDCETKGVMLICMRHRDNKYQKAQMLEREGVVAGARADRTACYEGQRSVFRMFCGSI